MIDYSEDWILLLLFQREGSVAARALMFAIPAAFFTLTLLLIEDFYPGFKEAASFKELEKGQLWSATTGVLTILLSFRTNRAMGRFWEGTGLLHQMRGEWFDSVSCCVTFSNAAKKEKRKEVLQFRHTLVRLMSLCHGNALAEIADVDNETESTSTIDSFGLDNRTLHHLKVCKNVHKFNSVEVLLHMIQSLITNALHEGVVAIPPPILSRVYQTLSRGFVNLLNAKKIADTRFPFPYAQLITFLLIVHLIMTPLIMASIFSNKAFAMAFTFVPLFAMYSINFIGVQLENPFGDDENDLPLDHFQSEMNSCLLMLLQENSDLIPNIDESRYCNHFSTLKSMLIKDHLADGVKPRLSLFVEKFQEEDPEWQEDLGDYTTDSMAIAEWGTPRSDESDDTPRSDENESVTTPVTPLYSEKKIGARERGEERPSKQKKGRKTQGGQSSSSLKVPPVPSTALEKTTDSIETCANILEEILPTDSFPSFAPDSSYLRKSSVGIAKDATSISHQPTRYSELLDKNLEEFNQCFGRLTSAVNNQNVDLNRTLTSLKDVFEAIPIAIRQAAEGNNLQQPAVGIAPSSLPPEPWELTLNHSENQSGVIRGLLVTKASRLETLRGVTVDASGRRDAADSAFCRDSKKPEGGALESQDHSGMEIRRKDGVGTHTFDRTYESSIDDGVVDRAYLKPTQPRSTMA